jgi:ArsR family transcriptional regulator, arsenate/arsenite/antimonite-responsive transcriptional repressor
MEENQALDAFAAISNQTRLRIVRMLVVAGADGRSAGAIAEVLDGASASRTSFHLNQLAKAGLIESRREGRSIIYSAIFSALSDLVAFLMHDCCEGHCAVCDRAIALFAKCTGRPTKSLLIATAVTKRPLRRKAA